MSDNTNLNLCPNCTSAIFCDTWGQFKCTAKKRYISNYRVVLQCESYKKRPKDYKDRKCQCEDCLKNAALAEEYLEVE